MLQQILLSLCVACLAQGYHDLDNAVPVCGSGIPGEKGSLKKLRYVMGDALTDRADCMGPDGKPYPSEYINKLLPKLDVESRLFLRSREGRTLFDGDRKYNAEDMRKTLLNGVKAANKLHSVEEAFSRQKREAEEDEEEEEDTKENDVDNDADETSADERPLCREPAKKKEVLAPARLCKTSYNTTAPMFGVSLTSGKPVTIVQKFPDLLQQIVYETCESKDCDMLHGECVQTYLPYLFLVVPLGPVTLTGQDYVLVEAGCSCKPKYATDNDPNPLSVIPSF